MAAYLCKTKTDRSFKTSTSPHRDLIVICSRRRIHHWTLFNASQLATIINRYGITLYLCSVGFIGLKQASQMLEWMQYTSTNYRDWMQRRDCTKLDGGQRRCYNNLGLSSNHPILLSIRASSPSKVLIPQMITVRQLLLPKPLYIRVQTAQVATYCLVGPIPFTYFYYGIKLEVIRSFMIIHNVLIALLVMSLGKYIAGRKR